MTYIWQQNENFCTAARAKMYLLTKSTSLTTSQLHLTLREMLTLDFSNSVLKKFKPISTFQEMFQTSINSMYNNILRLKKKLQYSVQFYLQFHIQFYRFLETIKR